MAGQDIPTVGKERETLCEPWHKSWAEVLVMEVQQVFGESSPLGWNHRNAKPGGNEGAGGWSGVEVQRGKRSLGAGGGQLGRPCRLGAGRGMGPQSWHACQHHCQRWPGWESHNLDREGAWSLGSNCAARFRGEEPLLILVPR